jgi:glycosyltransferase involved in cell wall biosynthesis
MKVGIIAPPWLAVPPVAYGGTETVLDILARGLVMAGHEVCLFTIGDSTCPVPKAWEFERALGVGMPGSAAEIRHVVAAYKALAGCDVIHDHSLVGLLYAQMVDSPPVVTTNHGPFASDLGPLYRAVCERVGVIAISRSQAAEAEGVRLAGVIHHGVEVERFPFGKGRGGYALFLGRMTAEKGVHVAARAARAAGVPLVVAAKMSEPAEKAYFQKQVKPLLGGNVEYVGEVGGAEKAELLADALCLLNPIDWPEPFGMVMVEAGACGTPVVATARGAAPEIVMDEVSGFVCADEAALVEALGRVEELERDMCRQVVAELFAAERMVDRHLSVYRRALASKGRSPAVDLADPQPAGHVEAARW